MRAWLNQFSLKTRLLALLALLLSLLVTLTLMGLNGVQHTNGDLQQLYFKIVLPQSQLTELSNQMATTRSQLLLAL